MELNILKEVNVELCENIYALSMNYLKKNNSAELNSLILIINDIEKKIRKCRDMNSLNAYIVQLKEIVSRIEGIIYE